MRFTIRHEVPGRIRFALSGKIPESDAIALEELFAARPGVVKCVAYPKAGCLAVSFEAQGGATLAQVRNGVVAYLRGLDLATVRAWEPDNSLALAPRPRHLYTQLATMTVNRVMRRAFLPVPVRMALSFWNAIPFWRAALASLRARRLDVPVLDGAAIAMGFLQTNKASAGGSMFLLRVSDVLEDYTQRRSSSSLVQSLLDIPQSARLVEGDVEVEVPIESLRPGQVVVVRMGDSIPVDGAVVKGEAAVNQASLTGESLAVVRKVGDTVFAGTSLEEGEILVSVTGDPSESKVRSIVSMVEQSEARKSASQKRIESMADKLVPWNFLLAGIVALTTRSITKTSAALMVDYSCALRLSGAIAVMAAQRESAARGFTVKGSRDFEHMAQANVIVFDKTGTLTSSVPRVCCVDAYGEYSEEEVLRLAACLEEHFPHPVARAVVEAASQRNLEHRERHAEVEYVVAHGIASSLDGKRCVIGSAHFVLEDEGVSIDPAELERILERSNGASPLFLAVDNKLQGVVYIEDPLKPNAAEVVAGLREVGFERVIMLTGDNERTAARIAAKVGIDEFRANLLPEDKHAFIERLQAEGHRVCMVGDGVNDSPALSAAHVSISMAAGSAVAREAADIALSRDNLEAIIELRRLSQSLQARLGRGYRFAIGFNTALLASGIAGLITPSTSAFLHNGGTVALAVANTKAYLPEGE